MGKGTDGVLSVRLGAWSPELGMHQLVACSEIPRGGALELAGAKGLQFVVALPTHCNRHLDHDPKNAMMFFRGLLCNKSKSQFVMLGKRSLMMSTMMRRW